MKLAIFDFDGTLFCEDTLLFLLNQWKKQRKSILKYFRVFGSLVPLSIKYKLGIKSKLSKEEMKALAVKKFNNIFIGMTEKDIKDYFYQCSIDIKDLLNKSIVEELEEARKSGYHTVLLSGSYEHLLKYIGDALGIDTVIGTKMNFTNELFDKNKEINIISGSLKLEKINEHYGEQSIEWESSCAYADSYSDIHILKSVGQPIAVRPDDQLKAIAGKENWKIIA